MHGSIHSSMVWPPARSCPSCQLEESAAGCRWLLQRWAEFRNLLDRKLKWEETELLRFIRLQGKNVVESVYDPALNSIFLAWEVLVEKYAQQQWHYFQELKPRTDPAFNHRLLSREIAARPSDAAAAWAVLYGIVAQHVERLVELLAANEASEAEADPDWADRAAYDGSPAFERHRRYQSAKTREMHRTLETLRRMRNSDLGTGNEVEEMAEGECPMANDERQAAEGEGPVHEGGCDEGQHSELMTEGSIDPVVEHDSQPITEDATDEGAQAGGQPGQCKSGQCLLDPRISPSQWLHESRTQNPRSKISVRSQKAPNEPKLESTQSTYSQGFESENAGPLGRERSQSAAGGQVVHNAGNDRVEMLGAAGELGREDSVPPRLSAGENRFGPAAWFRAKVSGSPPGGASPGEAVVSRTAGGAHETTGERGSRRRLYPVRHGIDGEPGGATWSCSTNKLCRSLGGRLMGFLDVFKWRDIASSLASPLRLI